MKKTIITVLFTCLLTLLSSIHVFGQDEPQHRLSPVVIESTMIGDTYVKVVYGQPYKRGREIFGGLVPYGEVWRTGANEATEITLTGNINFGGENLEAGVYSLFTIPEEDSWTVIVSSQLGQWGAYRYDEKRDVFRFQVPSEETEEVIEPFTIRFADDGKSMTMKWDRTQISIPVSEAE